MRKLVEELLVDNDQRKDKLIEVLEDNKISYITEENNNVTNIIVHLGHTNYENGGVITLGAHYDIFPGSTGINDNTCAVAMLIEFLKEAKELKENFSFYPLDIVFFGKEELGMQGSNLYASKRVDKITSAIIFDIIGYGDTLVYGTEGLTMSFERVGVREIDEVLPSDNLSFKRYDIPVALITALHDEDTLDTDRGSLRIVGSPRFYDSFHGGSCDNDLEIINFDLMKRLLNGLIFAVFYRDPKFPELKKYVWTDREEIVEVDPESCFIKYCGNTDELWSTFDSLTGFLGNIVKQTDDLTDFMEVEDLLELSNDEKKLVFNLKREDQIKSMDKRNPQIKAIWKKEDCKTYKRVNFLRLLPKEEIRKN